MTIMATVTVITTVTVMNTVTVIPAVTVMTAVTVIPDTTFVILMIPITVYYMFVTINNCTLITAKYNLPCPGTSKVRGMC